MCFSTSGQATSTAVAIAADAFPAPTTIHRPRGWQECRNGRSGIGLCYGPIEGALHECPRTAIIPREGHFDRTCLRSSREWDKVFRLPCNKGLDVVDHLVRKRLHRFVTRPCHMRRQNEIKRTEGDERIVGRRRLS